MGGTMRWAELRMCRFWAGGISSFPFSRAREYRLLRRLTCRKQMPDPGTSTVENARQTTGGGEGWAPMELIETLTKLWMLFKF